MPPFVRDRSLVTRWATQTPGDSPSLIFSMSLSSGSAPVAAAAPAIPHTLPPEKLEALTFQTRVLHADGHDKPLNAHTMPIFQTSTFIFDSPDQGAALFAGKATGHIYRYVSPRFGK